MLGTAFGRPSMTYERIPGFELLCVSVAQKSFSRYKLDLATRRATMTTRQDAKAGSLIVDLSHTITNGMITYKGLPGPLICDHLSREQSRSHYAPGTEFQIGRIDMVSNTGTYLDTPYHRYPDGIDLADLPMSSIANLPGIVFRVT